MTRSRFTESKIVAIPRDGEAGVSVAQLARKHGISAATYYHRKSKYAGAAVTELKRLRELEAENAKLKRMYADLALEYTAIKDVPSRKALTPSAKREAIRRSLGEDLQRRSPVMRGAGSRVQAVGDGIQVGLRVHRQGRCP